MTARRIVLDANIVIRAVLGTRVPALIAEYGERVSFCVPTHVVTEAARSLSVIAQKRGADPEPFLAALDAFCEVAEFVPPEVTGPLEQTAKARIGSRDASDWPVVAAALALDCPIWTEDQDFFGVGIPAWTSATVELYLRST